MIKRTAAILVMFPAMAFAEPRLVSSWPANGADDVEAGEQTLVLEFNEPMARDRMSVTTGTVGATPEFIGTPTFSADGRTFRVRMKLKPGLTYIVGANGPNHGNFQNERGDPAVPAMIHFSTVEPATR